jgi:DNA-binding MarR family transcriptional regulator
MKLVKDKWNRATDKPYDMCLRSVREDLRISGDAYRLYVTLLNGNTDPKVGKVYTPTVGSLANQFKVGASTIKRWLAELKKYGYIAVLGSKDDGYVMYVSKQSLGVVISEKKKKKGSKMNPSIDENTDDMGSKMNPSIDSKNDEMGSNMTPSMGSNLTPIIKTYAAPPPAGSSICQQAVPEPKEEKVEIGSLGLECVTHSPSAATPSGQPTEMLHTPKGIGRNEVIEMTPEEIETLSKSLPF